MLFNAEVQIISNLCALLVIKAARKKILVKKVFFSFQPFYGDTTISHALLLYENDLLPLFFFPLLNGSVLHRHIAPTLYFFGETHVT